MASFFSRIFKLGQAEAHSALDGLEDPIKMSEQGVRDLRKSLTEAMTSLAQVKSVAIRLKKDADDHKRSADEYERKAMLLLQRAQAGSLDNAEAEQLATTALSKKDNALAQSTSLAKDYATQQAAADRLQSKVDKLRRDISRIDNELVTLRARARTADSMKKINRQLADVDSSSTLAMLERMKNKVEEEEALAHAYGELSSGEDTEDQQIDKALELPAGSGDSDSLAALKAKMGIE